MNPIDEDQMEIEITDNGLIKITTPGSISAANHAGAEAFFRFIATMTDGSNVRGKVKEAHGHHHDKEAQKQ